MTADEARDCLLRAGFQVASDSRLPNNTGVQLRLTNEAVVNVFDKGTFNVQGRHIEEVQAALGVPAVAATAGLPAAHASPKK